MPKSKRKTKQIKVALKYELYGIAIIIISWIALSGQGRVARALTYMFRFLVGELDWVIPVFFIYAGLYVMIKRSWPNTWNAKRTGALMLGLGLILYNHISMITILDPQADFTAPSYILKETWRSMMDGFHAQGQDSVLQKDVGGGMLGAVLYATLYFLFGSLGSRLIMYTLFVIAFLLITGVSIVELGVKMRARAGGKGLSLRALFFGQKGKKKPSRRPAPEYVPPFDDELDEETLPPDKSKTKKKAIFFQLLQNSDKSLEDDDEDEEVPVKRKGKRPVVVEVVDPVENQNDDHLPSVRDFRDSWDNPPWEEKPGAVSSDPVPGTHSLPAAAARPSLPSAAAPVSPAEGMAEPANGDEEFDKSMSKPTASTYKLPSLSLLSKPAGGGRLGDLSDSRANARKLEATLESFGVRAKVLDVVRGPTVTRYEIQPDVGVKVSRIVSLTDDIALALAAKDIRMEAPIPGKSAIGIEVPNTEVSIVTLREVMDTPSFQDSDAKLSISFGRDISGQPIVGNLARMPHLLVAGATGSGKSVCINGIITSILYKARPDEVKFIMIDPKMVELNVYNGIPHLLAPVVTDPRRASLALKKVVVEMEKRYELFSKSGTRNMEGYNALVTDPNSPNPAPPLPFIVVIVDELADLMMVAANDVEDSICRLAQMARAAGIHLIIATQRPSVDVITGVIKANIPSRIAFGVSSQVDSRTILDMVGAEKLLGRGDMLYMPVGASKPIRVQGAFLSDHEVESVVHFVRDQEQAQYQEEMVPQLEEQGDGEVVFEDELYDQAVQIVLEAKQASVSLLQRRMRVGYTRAARLIDTMEAKGIVGPYEGSKPREVLVSLEQWQVNRKSG